MRLAADGKRIIPSWYLLWSISAHTDTRQSGPHVAVRKMSRFQNNKTYR
jgi:hypothetical protein